MRIAGLDVGDRTIGVAVSDLMGWTAQGLEVIRRKDLTGDLKRLQVIAAQHEVTEWVVGLPRNMNGSYGPRAELCREFAARLGEIFPGATVTLWDERLTTAGAQRALLEADVSRAKRKQVVDKIAAQLILQGYLDFRAHKKRQGGAE